MNWFTVYSRMYNWTKDDKKKYLPKGSYTLLEPIQEWYGDRNRGLAMYLDEDDELGSKIEYIHYKCVNDGYVEFSIKLKKDEYDKITYNGEECTLKEAVCEYIKGQIADGWGENGIYVLKGWVGNEPRWVDLTWELYEKDYEKSIKLAEKHGERILMGIVDKYSAYKLVKFKK